MGAFNHAIVVVPGTPEIWIDPTDRYARAGELPAGDQGRPALIASLASGGLVRTPEAAASDNRQVVTREIFLADLGPARLVETTEFWGEGERAMRAQHAAQDEKTRREVLTEYLQSTFLSDKLEKLEQSNPADLASPYRLRLEASEVPRGYTDSESAVVAVFPASALSGLPDEISEGEEGAEPKPRQSEYLLAQPILMEVHYRAVPPAGFRPKPLPQGRVQHFGPATLSEEYTAAADGTVAATLRFEIGKRRLTAEEFNALREGVREVSGEDAVLLEFEQVGEAHLAAGRVREALDELRKLADLSPQKALPRTRLARALLAGGMGEAAREEARRAIALEPSFAIAHRDLAWILQHDEVGRRFGEGFDRDGALAAYRKAKELDPEEAIARADLAILLEHDEKGQRYAKGSDLAAAIDEYRALRTDLDNQAMDANLLFALLRAGRFAEMKELLAELAEPGQHAALWLVAAATTEGSEAAVREAERRFPEVEERRNALLEAAQHLIQTRRYQDAAALLAGAARQAPNAAEILTRVETMRKLRRHEDLTFSPDEPADVASQWFLLMASQPLDVAKIKALYSRDFIRELGSDEAARRRLEDDAKDRRGPAQEGVPSDLLLDLIPTIYRATVTGDDAVGYRVALTTRFNNDRDEIFMVREDGALKIAGLDDLVESLGLEALRRLQRDDLRGARQWLDWAREEVRNVGGDDPLASSPFAALWTQGTEATAGEARCAAASLLVSGGKAEKAVPLLLSCRDAAPDGARRTALDLALAVAYSSLNRHAELAEEARRLVTAFPRSQRAYLLLEGALAGLGRWDELRRFAEERLAVTADDPMPWLTLYGIAGRQGDLDESERVLRRIVESGKAGSFVFNNLAWLALVRGKVDDQAIEHAQRAAALDKYKDPGTLHTLASLYAEQGRTAEAYQLILQALAASSAPRPEPHDWFVFGLLAEHYGLPEAARRYYARVTPPGPGAAESTSTYRLAQRRLAATSPEAALPAQ
jgi:tetratricopeptide (TPR) repeat protein